MNMNFFRKLPVPQDMKRDYPLDENMKRIKDERAEEIRRIFTGESDKFMLVIGPCSADNRDSVLDYISRLKRVEEQVKDKIFIVPRI